MSGQTFDGPPPGAAVSRGRNHLTPAARVAVAAFVGLGVVGSIGYVMMPNKPKAPAIETFNHSGGRPWSAPLLADPTPAKVAPAAAAPPAATAHVLPPPVATTPTAQPMGFWQNPSVYQGVQSAAQQAATSGAGRNGSGFGPSAMAGINPQEIGTDPAQRHAGIARATVGKPFNRHLLLQRNTQFQCVPVQPLDSDVPGPITCKVSDDVKSADGLVVLIEKDSFVMGEVAGAPNSGSNRMFVEFDQITTSNGIPIYFNGSGGDELGTSGVDGAVNEHMWRKLKGALLLSAVQVVGSIAQNETQQAGNLNLNVGSSGQSLAEQALAHDINIAPTLYRNRADPITVTVRQDIPMDDVYRLVTHGDAQ